MRIAVGIATVVVALGTLPGVAQTADPPGNEQPGRPADLCRELVAFLRQPDPRAAGDGKVDAKLSTAVQAPKAGDEAPKAAGDGAPPQSGISGPISKEVGQGAPGPQGDAQKTAAPAAAPPSPSTASMSALVGVEEAERMADAGNFAGCRDATQRLRRAGAPLPESLIALGALDTKFFTGAPL